MSESIEIIFSWEKRIKPQRFEEEDFVDVTPLVLSLERFVASYQGGFMIKINGLGLQFDFRPDLSTIFEDLPDMLEKLRAETESPFKLHFSEQGTDLALFLTRRGDMICINFEKGPSAGERFDDLPDATFTVPADLFLGQWIHFIQEILSALIVLQPDLETDESYQHFNKRVLQLKN